MQGGSVSLKSDCDGAASGLRAMATAIPKSLPDAVEEAADIFVNEGKRRAPVRGGKLQREIKHVPYKRTRDEAVQKVYVNARYAHIVEYGRKGGYLVKPRSAAALQTNLDDFAMYGKPGPFGGHPFMRPALDSKRREMSRVIFVRVKRVAGRARDLHRNYR
jgi:hypothetical protein